MKKLAITTAAALGALAAVCAWGEWVYEGQRGSLSTGDGQFDTPGDVAASPSGARIYVADHYNDRIQYFNRNEPAVGPTSLGRVKALFR